MGGTSLRAKQLGLVAFDGTLRLQRLCKIFHERYAELAAIPGWDCITTVTGSNAGFLGGLFRHPCGFRHPFKHHLIQALLYESPHHFLKDYKDHKHTKAMSGVQMLVDSLRDSREMLLKMVGQDLLSVNQAAQSLGVPVSQAIKHLDREGVPRIRRPRIIGTHKEVQLIEMLRRGLNRVQIGKALSIRTGFIKDYLATRPDLLQEWSSAKTEQQKNVHRHQFLLALKNNPGLPIKKIRRLPMNGFQWLYHNDLEWLRSVLPAIWHKS